MTLKNIIGCMLTFITCFNATAQIDSMEVNGTYYKIYPYPENVNIHSDYWVAVKDKEYFLDPENYFQLFGESRNFTREKFATASELELEMLNNQLKQKWKNLRGKDFRLGLGPRYVKQVRKHPGALIGPNYNFNKEVIPPFSTIPDGKYVQVFSPFCKLDKKGMCHQETRQIAGYFNIKNNAIDGHAVWLNLDGDTLKQGNFVNGLKDGEWTFWDIDPAPRYLRRYKTKSFRKTGKFTNLDTVYKSMVFSNGVPNGRYVHNDFSSKLKIVGEFIDGEEAGNWKTYWDTALVRNVTYADASNEVVSHRPIIRTDALIDGNSWEYALRDYEYGRMEIPADFYKIGFEEELDIELLEEKFKSHELEYYGSYRNGQLPNRYRGKESFYRIHKYFDFQKDPSTDLVETRGYFIDSIGAKMLYDGPFELFYPNGQLYTRYEFKNGELIEEDTLFWDNGQAHDVIVFVPDSNHYLRHVYDYEGVKYKTAIYDSLGDFVRFDEIQIVEPTLEIDGITAELKKLSRYTMFNFEGYMLGNWAYYNWDSVEEELPMDKEITFYRLYSGVDSTILGELNYNHATRTMTDYDLSYTGAKRWTAEKVFTDDFSGWTGKSEWVFGDFKVITTASGILKDFDQDTLPQIHLRRFYSDYNVTQDVEVLYKGEPYTGKVKIDETANRFKMSKNKLILAAGYGKKRTQRKLYKYFKKGKYKDDRILELVSSVSDCGYINSHIRSRLFDVAGDSYFRDISEGYSGYYSLNNLIKSDVRKIEGQMVEGRPQGAWVGKSKNGKLLSEIAFDRGEPMGVHNRYAIHSSTSKWQRYKSSDSLPKRKQYFLYSTTEYDKGMLNGPYNQYYWHGAIQERGSFVDDYLEGEYLDRATMAYSISNFKDGLLDGYVQTYLTLPYEDTMLLYDLNFQHGLLNGKSVSYHTNGKLAKQGFFLDGEPIDDYEAYDTLGFRYHYVKFQYSYPVEEKIWEENQLSLRYLFDWEDSIAFDPSDITSSMSLESLLYKLGYGSGSLQEAYYGRPRLIDKTGLEYHMTKFYPNDTIAREGKITDGKKIGHWTFFDYEGEFLYEVNYFDSIITLNDSVMFKSKGLLTDYDDEGNKLFDAYIIEKMEKYDCAHTDHYEIRQLYTVWEANDTLGRMNGYVQNFYDNGVLQNEGYMKNGLPTGLWKYYDPFGKLNLMGSFHQGKRHGRWLSGDLEKKKYLGEICLNPNLPDLEEEKQYRENLLDITIINYKLGKSINRQFYDLNLNKYTNLQD